MDKASYLILRYLELTAKPGDSSPLSPSFGVERELEARIKRIESAPKVPDTVNALSALQELAGTKGDPDEGSPVTITFDGGGTHNYHVASGKEHWYGATITDAMALRAEHIRHKAELEKLNGRSVAAH